jgi:hypothetical protein
MKRLVPALLLIGCATHGPVEAPLKGVEVRVNGTGPHIFTVDTGANETLIDEKITRADHADLQIGAIKLKDVPCKPAGQNILGLDVLQRFNVTLDSESGKLTLRPRGKPHGQTGTEIPFEIAKPGRIVVRGKLNDRDILWQIATGFSPAAVHASLRAYEEADVGVSTAAEAEKRGEQKVTIVLLRKVSIGPYSKTLVAGLAGTFPKEGMGLIEGILTLAYFGNSAVTFDFDRNVLIVR